MAIKTKIKALVEARSKYEQELKGLGKKAGEELAEHIGALIPEGCAIQWTGSTPSFNDGEPCRFSVCTPRLFRIGLQVQPKDEAAVEDPERPDEVSYDFEEGVDPYEFHGSVDLSSYNENKDDLGPIKVTITAFKALRKAWDEIPEDMLEQIFGDGHRVRITSGGELDETTYEEY